MSPPEVQVCFAFFFAHLSLLFLCVSTDGYPSFRFQRPAASSQHRDLVPLPPFILPVVHPNEQIEDADAHDDNVNFLRSHVPLSSPDSSSLGRQHRRRSAAQQQQNGPDGEGDNNSMDYSSSGGLGESNSRIHWINRQRAELSNAPNYESRLPDLRSLYGWAPGEDDPAVSLLQDWIASDAESARDRLRQQQSDQSMNSSSGNGRHSESPLRGPFLRSLPQNSRFPRTRTLHNYLMERVERDWDAQERERLATSTSRTYRSLPSSHPERRALTHNDLRSRIVAHRMCLGSQSSQGHSVYPRLKETIKYLGRLRYSSTYEESARSAAANGFGQLEDFCNEDDFVLDTASIAPPTECSWLRPGMVFLGSQCAARQSSAYFSSRNEPVIVDSNNETHGIQVQTSGGRRYVPESLHRAGANSKDEKWPVKVTIHSINHDDMTISGIMEAYNFPDKTSSTPDARVVTFLEGEIIDFNKFTLETGNCSADADTDSAYWRQLQPFKHLTDAEVVKNLVNRKWINEELSERWLLMRWKGKSCCPQYPFFFFF